MSELFPKIGENPSYKVSEDVAQSEIEQIEEELGTLSNEQRLVFLDAIRRGNLSFRKESCEITYVLEKPVGDIKEITIPELNTSQLQEISKGDIIKTNQKGEVTLALKDQQIQRTIRLLNRVCGCKLTDIDKIKKRDLGVLIMVSDFLG